MSQLAENLFRSALGDPATGITRYTRAQEREIESILEMLEKAGYLLDEAASIPALAHLGAPAAHAHGGR